MFSTSKSKRELNLQRDISPKPRIVMVGSALQTFMYGVLFLRPQHKKNYSELCNACLEFLQSEPNHFISMSGQCQCSGPPSSGLRTGAKLYVAGSRSLESLISRNCASNVGGMMPFFKGNHDSETSQKPKSASSSCRPHACAGSRSDWTVDLMGTTAVSACCCLSLPPLLLSWALQLPSISLSSLASKGSPGGPSPTVDPRHMSLFANV